MAAVRSLAGDGARLLWLSGLCWALGALPVLAADPHASPAIAGVRLGMSASEAEAALSGFMTGAQIRHLASRTEDGKGTYVSGVVAEVATGTTYDDDAVIVLLTRSSGTAYQVLREKNYGPGHEVAAETLEAYVRDQFGLSLVDRTTHVEFNADGNLVTGPDCALVEVPDQFGPNANRLLSRSLLADMHIWDHVVEGCGVSLRIYTYPTSASPDVISGVTQQMIDQHAVIADIAAVRAARDAAAAKASRDAAQAAKGNKTGL